MVYAKSSAQQMPSLIGVVEDANTCRVAIANAEGQILARSRSGSCNIQRDYLLAKNNVITGVKSAWHKTGASFSSLSDAFCVIGLSDESKTAPVARLTKELPFNNSLITDLAIARLTGAFGQSDGIQLEVGTEFSASRQVKGKVRKIGGWAPPQGEDGSTTALGVALLRLILKCADGLFAHSELTRSVFGLFKGQPRALVKFIEMARPFELAEYGVQVLQSSHCGDPNALRLLAPMIRHIEDCIDTLQIRDTLPIVLSGDVRHELVQHLARKYRDGLVTPKGDASEGAVALAAALTPAIQRPLIQRPMEIAG